MKELKCVSCGRVLNSGPIHCTDSGEYRCSACFNAPQQIETLVCSKDVQAVVATDHQIIQTDRLSTKNKQIETDKKGYEYIFLL